MRNLLLVGTVFCCFMVIAAENSALTGRVSFGDGKPVAGADVYGENKCCPLLRAESTQTDKDGRFTLKKPGEVVHIWKENYQSQVLVLQPGTKNIDVQLETIQNPIHIPPCERKTSLPTIVEDFLRVEIPRVAKIKRGKWDVDYVHHVIKAPSGSGYMGLSFGPMSTNGEPDDEHFKKSQHFKRRSIVNDKGQPIGTDTIGTIGPKSWRFFAIVGTGQLVYDNASPDDAKLFDQVIESVCALPPHKEPLPLPANKLR